MRRWCLVGGIVAILLSLPRLSAAGGEATKRAPGELTLDELINAGIACMHNMATDCATENVNRLLQRAPDDPRSHLLHAAVSYLQFASDPDNKEHEKAFNGAVKKTIQLCQRHLARNRVDTDAMFYSGFAYIYAGAYQGKDGNYLRAYWNFKEGLNYLKRVVELDPEYYDAYFGLGLFHYYAEVMPRFIKSLSFILGIEADRRLGLQELQIAAEKGTYLQSVARFMLAYIYQQRESKHEESRQLFAQLVERYPDNIYFRHGLGESLRQTGAHRQAKQQFEMVLDSEKTGRYPRLLSMAYYALGSTYYELNEFNHALTCYKRAVEAANTNSQKSHWVLPLSYYQMGLCYEILGDRKTAVSHYEQVKKDDQGTYKYARDRLKTPMLAVDIALIRGRNLFRTKNFEAALATFERILGRINAGETGYPPEKAAEAHYNIGKTHYERYDYQSAINAFQQALALETDDDWVKPWTNYRLGECYRALGEHENALRVYDLAYKFDDNDLRFEIDKARENLQPGLSRKE